MWRRESEFAQERKGKRGQNKPDTYIIVVNIYIYILIMIQGQTDRDNTGEESRISMTDCLSCYIQLIKIRLFTTIYRMITYIVEESVTSQLSRINNEIRSRSYQR